MIYGNRFKFEVREVAGLEPAPPRSSSNRSNQLSYTQINLKFLYNHESFYLQLKREA